MAKKSKKAKGLKKGKKLHATKPLATYNIGAVQQS